MAPLTELPALNATRFSSPRFVAETGSTNADLLESGRNGGAEGAVLVAEHQTAGRGRQRRSWHDEPGNALLVSFLVRPTKAHAPLLSLLAGVAVCEALSHLSGAAPTDGPAGLKWPNDVLAPSLGERKLAGILAESTTDVGAGQASARSGRLIVVVGTGMNLRWGSQPPDEVAAKAATVTELLGAEVDRVELLGLYLRHVELWLRRIEAEGPDVLLDRYRSHCLTLDRNVRFATATTEYEGRAVAISKTGTLILETEDNGRVELNAGDAHHIA